MLSWILSSRQAPVVWDEQVSAAVAAVFLTPSLLMDLPYALRQHPLVQGAAAASCGGTHLSAGQKHDILHWFSGHGASLRMLLRADFFSPRPSMTLTPGSDVLAAVTSKLSQEAPQLKLSPDFAICACLTSPFSLLEYPREIQESEGVLVRVLEAAAFTAPGEWPSLSQMGAWKLWQQLPLQVQTQLSSQRALVFHLKKERALSQAPSSGVPAELEEVSSRCPVVQSWVFQELVEG